MTFEDGLRDVEAFRCLVWLYASDEAFREAFLSSPMSAGQDDRLNQVATTLHRVLALCESLSPELRTHVIFGLSQMIRTAEASKGAGRPIPIPSDISSILETSPLANLPVPPGYADDQVMLAVDRFRSMHPPY